MIRLKNVTQHYGVRPVLKNINMEINTGELVSIVGPNGMGKSTLLGVMAGILNPQHGIVEINGLKRRNSEEEELQLRKGVIYLPDLTWIPHLLTGREYLLNVGQIYEIDPERLWDHIDRLMRLFDLEPKANHPIHGYSTGQKKKIALCSALITEAPVLLLDEPFSGGLDPSGIYALKEVLTNLNKLARDNR